MARHMRTAAQYAAYLHRIALRERQAAIIDSIVRSWMPAEGPTRPLRRKAVEA